MGENNDSDDDLTGLFSQVAGKLGWKSDDDLDAVLSELTQSTKKKKKRKGSTNCQKKTKKTREGTDKRTGGNQSKTLSSKVKSSHREEKSDSHDLPRNDENKKPRVKSSRNNGVKINGTESSLDRPSVKYVREPWEQTSYSGLTNGANNDSVNGDDKHEEDEDQESFRSKEQRDKQKTNLSYESGQNDSVGSAIFDSPLPRILDFGGTPDESMVTKAINHGSPENSGCVERDEDHSQEENNAQTPQKSENTATPLSADFVDSPEPMHWLMSPQHKTSQSSGVPSSHVTLSSSDEDDDSKSRGIVDASYDVLADELPDFKVLSLTERLAQKHKESKQNDVSPARKGRRKSCANPRSRPLILDKDWADDDDDEKDPDDDGDENDDGNDKEEEEELEEDANGEIDYRSPNMQSNRQKSPVDDRVEKKTVLVEKANGNSFQNARLKDQDSSSDDDFESFLNAIKTPKHPRGTGQDSDPDEVIEVIDDDDDDFIDDTPLKSSSDDDDEDDVFYLKLINADNPLTSSKNRSIRKKRPIVGTSTGSVLGVVMVSDEDDDDDDDEDVFVLPKPTSSVRKEKPKVGISATTSKKTVSKPRHPLQTKSLSSNLTNTNTTTVQSKTDPPPPASFLRSLSTPRKGAVPRSRYVSDFKRHKDELTQRLFRLYNESVFEKKLPADFSITWNNRMRKTAGFCFYKKRLGERTARIELSVKVCDTAERLRDTLIHEMCHAAAWLIHGVSDGHGKFWKYWAAKANMSHPEIPVIKRCHTYEIQTKFKYKCLQCGNIIGRHSKSINTERFCCALCNGRLQLQPTLRKDGTPARPRGPNPFAAFVKENYASVKKTHGTAKHADVMRLLSQEFSSKAKITET